mmetsp:Transcript_15814/g.32069  ORF Transcript_15814/g.32069 Transcript_15814/m.32069 type:complete len:88 (+) Transcript_15814:655-918(+)
MQTQKEWKKVPLPHLLQQLFGRRRRMESGAGHIGKKLQQLQRHGEENGAWENTMMKGVSAGGERKGERKLWRRQQKREKGEEAERGG